MKTNKNYRVITDKIIELLERGTKPWQRPWYTQKYSNLIGKNEYRGYNPLIAQIDMELYGYTQPYFLSFNQAKERGWKIKKGSKATTLTFASKVNFKDAEGEEESNSRTYFIMKFYKVFNIACVDDTQAKKKIADFLPKQQENPDKPVMELDLFCKAQKVQIKHGGEEACYNSVQDVIKMPEFEKFSSSDAYYHTLLHEQVHATGNYIRLNRKLGNKFGSVDYAKEELIAELGSAFVAAELSLGEDLQLENHAAYIQSWLQILRDDDKAIFTAMTKAKAAADYLLKQANQQ